MKNHYVPQYYLSGFSNPSGKIWVYEKGTHNVFCAGIKRIANETGYYTDDWEIYLSNQIENPANKVIKK